MFSFGIVAEKFLRMTFLWMSVLFVHLHDVLYYTRRIIRRQQGQTRTREAPCPALFEQCVGSLTSPRNVNNEELRDGAYGFIFLGRDD